jgi:amidase
LVICGKTNTPEFGMQPTTEPLLHGATRNPWDLARTTGGSSGGSAAAVAAGMVPFAHGNDLGGSIRFPASACGLFGFKPSRARNPVGPQYGDVAGGFAVEHALTRSVRDSAALLDATSGSALGDPYPSWPAPPDGFAAAVNRDPGRLRVAYTTRTPDGQQAHPDCVVALHNTVALLASLGHEVAEEDLPGLDDRVGHAIGISYGAFVTWVVDYWTRVVGRQPNVDELEPYTWAMWQQGKTVTAGAYLMAVMDLQRFGRTVAGFFTRHDVWLTPTLASPPLPLGTMFSSPDDPWLAARVGGPFVAFPAIVANITGAPAMSLPLHWTEPTTEAPRGLPVGVHALTRAGADAALFSLAGQLEQAQPWAHRWPALAFEELP